MTGGKVSRRTFLESSAALTATAGAMSAVGIASGAAAQQTLPWYREAYRRAVIDMHIPDWDEKFLSKFDPDEYVAALVASRAQSIVCYCQSHVGLFNYPTRVGKQHAAFAGRDVFRELLDACHEQGIAVQLYTSLIFDRWAGDEHPEWRIRTWDGKIQGEGGRHAVLCPNSPYRGYVQRFVEEICEKFEFDGIRFDMTFWPSVCYCDYCKQRYANEVGGEIPLVVNWLDPKWVAFQRCRERWLVEFAKIATGTVRRLRPQTSVEHQSSTYPLNWGFGVTAPLAAQNDFLQGDFYGDQWQGSFVRKLLEELTLNRPFAYETSLSVSLQDHTARKSEPLLQAKASAAIADQAAFVFIDAIDPIGTVNLRGHRRMGKVFDSLMPYYPHLGGERVAEIGIYYSPESKFSFVTNGRHVREADRSDTHTTNCMAVARRLLEHHLPMRVVTKKSLSDLGGVGVLILSDVNMMDRDEAAAIRAWVEQGGKLYASGSTSVVDTNGQQQSDFLLADVFGVSLVEAGWGTRKRYLNPTRQGQKFFTEFDQAYPAFVANYGMRIGARSGADVLATTTLPWPAPDGSQFSSIHSDPPWTPTDEPELVRNRFGEGTAIYSASPIESVDVLSDMWVRLIRSLETKPSFEADAPPPVEITLFRQPERNRYILTMVNFQEQLPNIPVDGIRLTLRLEDADVRRVVQLPSGREIDYHRADGSISFTAERLTTLGMYAVETV